MADSHDTYLDPPEDDPERPGFEGSSVSIVDELKSAYLDYAMSVIVSRAIPDLRDGLKPVHRRILYAMLESGNTHDKPYRKSARPVGDVMGKYHPHGDSAIYDALVRMAQDFSMSVPLLDGQGNFGSMDGDNPAAMRYTEVRMAKVSQLLLTDIDLDTVDFQPNYDGKDTEPTVLPSRIPNLLVNGGSGIAVGMATNIPPHNLGEVIDATLALLDDPDISIESLMEYLPGPDFPTGGIIQGQLGAMKAYYTGRGRVVVRAKTRFEEARSGRTAIIVEEIPYQVNKSALIERIAEIAKEKKVEGLAHIQDESDRSGVRIVIELKRDATPEIVLNQLWRSTQLETAFSCNMLALNGGQPELLNLVRFLNSFIDFREEIVVRRTAERLRRARNRCHLLSGLAVAVANIDEVVLIIRTSAQPSEARERLMEREWPAGEIEEYVRLVDDPTAIESDAGTYKLSDIQARAVLDLRLQRLTALGINEIGKELEQLAAKIVNCLQILSSGERIKGIIADELRQVKEEFAIPRRTEINEFVEEIDDEDLIEPEDVVVSVTHSGYIKRTPLAEYRPQRRGGKGLTGMKTKESDFVISVHVANTHDALLFFTTDGMVYKLKAWRIPKGGRIGRGKALVNLLPIDRGVSIAAITPIDVHEDDLADREIILASSTGSVRRNSLSDFAYVRSNGKRAIQLPEGATLVNALICADTDDVMLATETGNAIRFSAQDLRVFKSRNSTGVRGIRLKDGDCVVSMEVVRHFEASPQERSAYLKARRTLGDLKFVPDEDSEEFESFDEIPVERVAEMKEAEDLLLTITCEGLGKISSSHNYPLRNRGGKGVKANKQGGIIAFLKIELDDQIMLATNSGRSIRCNVSDISFQSRTAGGVKVLYTTEDEQVVSVARIESDGEEEDSETANAEVDNTGSSAWRP